MTLFASDGSIVAELLLSDNGEPGILAGPQRQRPRPSSFGGTRPWSMIEWSNPRRRFERAEPVDGSLRPCWEGEKTRLHSETRFA
jgi:hypothetical protein